MIRTPRPLALALAVTLAGCAAPPATPSFTAADAAAVDSVRMRWQEAYNARNVDGIIALYAESATYDIGNSPRATGKAAIRTSLTSLDFADTTAHPRVWIDADEAEGAGNLAVVAGSFRVAPTGDTAMVLPGKYLVVLKKEADGWRIAYHHGSLDVTPPAPPPPPRRR